MSILFLSFLSLIQFLFPVAISVSNNIPSIVLPSLVTTVTIVVAFVTLSFNLNSIPQDLIRKYILKSRFLGRYVGLNSGFILVFLLVIYTGFYGEFWDNLMISGLAASIATSLVFIKQFTGRANKEAVYQEIKSNATWPSPENVISLGFLEYSGLTPGSTQLELIASRDMEKSKCVSKSLEDGGLVRYDGLDLDWVKQRLGDITYLQIPHDNVIYAGGKQRGADAVTVCSENENAEQLAEKFLEAVTIEEVSWVEDWLSLLRHSIERDQNQIPEDFRFLREELIHDFSANPGIIALVLKRISQEFGDSFSGSTQLLREAINLAYSSKSDLAEHPQVFLDYLVSIKILLVNYILSIKGEYSPNYASATLYIAEQLSSLKDGFEEETITVDIYRETFETAIETNFDIIEITLDNFQYDEKVFATYLRKQVNGFTRLMSLYNDDLDFLASELDLVALDEDVESFEDLNDYNRRIVREKAEAVKDARSLKEEKLVSIALMILNRVEYGEVPTRLSRLAFEIMNETEIYEVELSEGIELETGFVPQDRAIAVEAPKWRYISLQLIRGYHRDMNPDLPQIPETAEKVSRTLTSLDYQDFSDILNISAEDFETAKEGVIQDLEAIKAS